MSRVSVFLLKSYVHSYTPHFVSIAGTGMTLILLNILQSFPDYFSKILYDITAYTLTAMVPILCFADPKGSVSSSQWIRGYISVMAALNDTYF
jgi:hypothetical protein